MTEKQRGLPAVENTPPCPPCKEPKHAGGRPRKYQSVEEMERAMEAYFLKCDKRTKQVVTGPHTNRKIEKVKMPEPYTIQGLAVALDLTTHGLDLYEEREEFITTVKRAKAAIEANKVIHMLDGDGFGAGYIFDLKHNHGWTDKHEIEHTGNMTVHFDGAAKDA